VGGKKLVNGRKCELVFQLTGLSNENRYGGATESRREKKKRNREKQARCFKGKGEVPGTHHDWNFTLGGRKNCGKKMERGESPLGMVRFTCMGKKKWPKTFPAKIGREKFKRGGKKKTLTRVWE